jgi:hypothetical protein
MTFQLTQTQLVDSAGGHNTSLASLFTVTATGNPAYLVVNAIDRNEYTAAATQATGYFSGNGHTLGLASDGSDGRQAGIVFTWQASTSSYVNATYGPLSRLSWTDPRSAYDVTNISVFGTSNAAMAQYDASNVYSLAQADAAGYLGSVTIGSDNGYLGPAPTIPAITAANATPDGVAAAAMAMVGKAWNENGCWVLASTIAAEAGSGLPVQSTMLGIPGTANGPWYARFNGPAGATGQWQSLVSAGEMVVFQTSATSGHITTCVSGSGASAKLVDNITYVNASGAVANPANDGSSADVTIAAPHPASQEFTGVSASSVVIYALDTPAVRDMVSGTSVSAGTKLALAALFSATDPLHKTINAYQVFLSSASDSLQINGHMTPSSANAPVRVTSLSNLLFVAGSLSGTDHIEIRASNGLNWGDWQSLNIAVAAVHGVAVRESRVTAAEHMGAFGGFAELFPSLHPHI